MGVVSLKIHRTILIREHAQSSHFVLEIENQSQGSEISKKNRGFGVHFVYRVLEQVHEMLSSPKLKYM